MCSSLCSDGQAVLLSPAEDSDFDERAVETKMKQLSSLWSVMEPQVEAYQHRKIRQAYEQGPGL